ncbi:16S rRNA (guanine(527)-N(7))-methyltransferase RsmG [Desulfohalobiaceae bacterium Ax17]|uniref:16S rRNA (guanine(527)-N(7))-methyltransferase RsmG n=1 Tax=Desulfovulcanus ferrireducens TaxID=2831190 RepID=UPI00207BBE19|nr:16S rRNA (guanine(527)-N(7))-methyltransferase RsmG [Desulfovulcanus ferrireducens]MBT8763847.1 16S rRNA (guanine(527)-N(7))-methyltransferase RsmG [Desulfovulcanus ferrireducens]
MKQILIQELSKELDRAGFGLDAEQIKKLYSFLSLLIKWNKVINLVGPKDWVEIFRTLIVDSLYLKDFLLSLSLKNSPRTFDLGAGAGLPGIPLRIVWNTGEYYLIEVRNKRAVFMRNALSHLSLPKTFVLGMRAQEVPEELLPPDLIISRAFMPWPKLLPLARKLMPDHGIVVVMANTAAPESDQLAPWQVKKTFSYEVQKKKRYFWALELNNCPN